MKFLEKINSPSDLRQLSLTNLQLYSSELRTFMLETMSRTGGHVAANLGVVELSVALHYVFDTPNDKLIWDVGHQCYAHKIITGRREAFHTIRQEGGLSGFTKMSESPFDAFGAGHSSTAVSAGLGLAESAWQKKTPYQMVSIIGDGALTAGMAYEGLNHGGHLRRPNHIIVLNDNEMSISENVSSLAKKSLKVMASKDLSLFEKARALKNSIFPATSFSTFFESLGYRYVGPVNGHDVPELVKTFTEAKKMCLQMTQSMLGEKEVRSEDAPLVIHVKTKKGLGLKTAEQRPGDFHGVTGFSLETGEPTKSLSRAPSYTAVFSETVCRLAENDPTLAAVTAAMPEGTGLSKFQKLFPERFYDVGIAEQHAVTFSGALKLGGMRPALALYSTFLQRAYDQVIHDIAIQKIPLALFLDRAGLVGADGPTHHGVFDMSFLRCLPGIHIMAPKDENELQHMVRTALYCEKLAVVRFPRGDGFGVALDSKPQMLPLGKSEKLLSHDLPMVTLWAAGSCVYPSLEAGKELQAMGINCEVVNARFIKPLDRVALIKDAQRSKLIVSVEENTVVGGLGSAILETLARENVLVPTLNLGVPDEFIEHGPQGRLRAYCHLDQKGIVAEILKKIEHLPGPAAKVIKPEPKKESSGKDPSFLTH